MGVQLLLNILGGNLMLPLISMPPAMSGSNSVSSCSVDTPCLNLMTGLSILSKGGSGTFALFNRSSGGTFIEPRVFGKLSRGFQESRLIRYVLEDDINFIVLVVVEVGEDDVSRGDLDFLVHLAVDLAEPLIDVDARGLAPAVSQHPEHLRILLSVFLKDQLALVVIDFILFHAISSSL